MLIFTALADPTRRRIVEMLGQDGPLSAGAISRHFAISAPAISQHLRLLKKAQLVQVEARAQQRIYSLDRQGVAQITGWAEQLQQHWQDRFDALETFLTKEETAMNTQPTFTLTRLFNVPRERMWRAWTEQDQFQHWFGPKGFKAVTQTMELRPGGILHTCLIAPDGTEMWGKFTYREVTPSTRLVWEHSFSDAQGNLTRHPYSAEWPLKLLTTVEFAAEKSGTRITLTWTPLDATEKETATFAAGMDSMHQGWSGTFEQLEGYLGK